MAKKKANDENLINVDEVYTKTEQFVDKNGCLSILPNSYGLDGIFAARLIKKWYIITLKI